MGVIDLEKTYDRVNREALWLVLRMYDVVSLCMFKRLRGLRKVWLS